jgi:uncharacterized protein
MTYLDLAEKILEEKGVPLTATEIWEWAVELGYDKQLKTVGNTPSATMSARLYVTANNDPESKIGGTDERPRRFFLKRLSNPQSIEAPSEQHSPPRKTKSKAYLEKDLHVFLSYFAYWKLKAYSKTISHSTSSKKEFGEWVHPDMVACYFPINYWKDQVYELSTAIGNTSIRLFSFELKRELSSNNLRASFFQAVSNSSWANESYLVAAEVSHDTDFLAELERLSASFGVGVIQLDVDDPDSSRVVFPAKAKESLDWETINKLSMNEDFKKFLVRVRIDFTTKTIHKSEYDHIKTSEELIISLSRQT